MSKSERTDKQSGQPARQWTQGVGARRGGGGLRSAASSGARPIKRAASATGTASSKSKGQPAKRFVEPFQFDEAQRRAVLDALTDAGLSDDDMREIFVGAIAYDLALLEVAASETALTQPEPSQRQASEREPPAPTETAEDGADDQRPLAATALRLAAQIERLSVQQRQELGAALRVSDPFDRDHDDAYLRALMNEIRRVAAAAADITALAPAPALAREPTRPPPAADAAPAPSRAAKPSRQPGLGQPMEAPSAAAIAFIQHAAKVYEQCFDSRPSSKASDPFSRVLKVIAKATGVPIPSQARVLKKALSQP